MRADAPDIVSHDVYERGLPFDDYRWFRDHDPVAWTVEAAPNHGFWSVTRHADLVAVHRDHRTFSSEHGGTELEELASDALEARKTMLETDPPHHRSLRRIVDPAFSRHAVDTYASAAHHKVREAIGAAIDRPGVEFVHDVARQLPISMLCDIVGVPFEDAEQLFAWTDAIVYHADPDFTDVLVDQHDTDPYRLLPFRSPWSQKVFDYTSRLMDARRRSPAGDLLTVMANAAIDDEPLTEQERNTFLLLILIAGNETTRHSLSHGLMAFEAHPDQLEMIRRDRSLVPTAVDEVLRWACPQIHFRRTATTATTLGGREIAPGDKVVTWYPSANFDDRVMDDPDRFDVTRTPNRHVTFGGGGPHLCLGQWLARLEVRVFVEALCELVDRIEVTGDIRRVRSNFINGVKDLPVRLVGR